MRRCRHRWMLLLAVSILLLTQTGSLSFFALFPSLLPAAVAQNEIPFGLSGEEVHPGIGYSSGQDLDIRPEQVAGEQQIVYTFSDLKTALESPEVTEIYLGADITTTSGVQISHQKPSLVIDGTNPYDPQDTRHTITQHSSENTTQVFYIINNSGLKDITVRNLHIEGSSFYGLVRIGNEVRDLTLSFEDVIYNGPQMVYNRWGTTRFTDCDIQIGRFGRGISLGEVAETRYIEFAGTVNISQAESQALEIIFIETGAGSIEVLPGAEVNVSTFSESGFVYSTQPYTMTVHEDAKFHYTAPRRFWEYVLMRDLTVKSGGEFTVELTGSIINDMVRVAGNVTVEPQGILQIIAQGTFVGSTYTALAIESGGTLSLDDPKCVLLYGGNRRPLVWYGIKGTFSARVQQVNHWNSHTAWGTAGTFSDPPTGRWHKNEDALFTFSGTASIGTTGEFTELTSNYDPSDTQGGSFDSGTFSLRGARAISLGRLDLSAEYLYSNDEPPRIVGGTMPLATVKASFPDGEGMALLGETQADGWGDFILPVEDGRIPAGVLITMEANWQFLFQEKVTDSELPSLGFYGRPNELAFETIHLSSQTILAMRRDPDWSISIRDTRPTGGAWRLTAQVLDPLTPAGEAGKPIFNAIALVKEGGDYQIIPQNSPILIYEHRGEPSSQPIIISWKSGEGILAIIQPGAALADVPYAGTIRWILEDAP